MLSWYFWVLSEYSRVLPEDTHGVLSKHSEGTMAIVATNTAPVLNPRWFRLCASWKLRQMYACRGVCEYAYVRIYIHTHTHTHTLETGPHALDPKTGRGCGGFSPHLQARMDQEQRTHAHTHTHTHTNTPEYTHAAYTHTHRHTLTHTHTHSHTHTHTHTHTRHGMAWPVCAIVTVQV